MSEYHKIINVFRRDEQTHKLKRGEWTTDELAFTSSCQWEATEKVDGTNIRVIYPNAAGNIAICGKTDRAQLKQDLVDAIGNAFPLDVLREKCANATFEEPIIFYGEGYGPGIQKIGSAYRPDKGFILFDIRVGHWWLRRGDVTGLATALGVEQVPVVARGTLSELVSYVEANVLSSEVAARYDRANVPMEGIVCRPYGCELLTRKGERLIVKIKGVDFNG
jgi:RNA ligase